MRLIDADTLWFEIIHYMDYCDDILELIEKMPTVPQWIPCSERLPEENGEYLVTREARGIYNVDIVKKTNTSGDIASDIVAWMPLPEPYREEGDE